MGENSVAGTRKGKKEILAFYSKLTRLEFIIFSLT